MAGKELSGLRSESMHLRKLTKVKFVKKALCLYEYEALEDGVILTSPRDHPTFGLKSLLDMALFVRKGQRFQLTREYVKKNRFLQAKKREVVGVE